MKLLTLLLACVMLSGCGQRECSYLTLDPNGLVTGYMHYKSNQALTDIQADKVTIKTPSGIVIEIDKATQDNDSIKASAIVGGVPVKVETNN